jgi:hypothetical protein
MITIYARVNRILRNDLILSRAVKTPTPTSAYPSVDKKLDRTNFGLWHNEYSTVDVNVRPSVDKK